MEGLPGVESRKVNEYEGMKVSGTLRSHVGSNPHHQPQSLGSAFGVTAAVGMKFGHILGVPS